MKTRIHQFLRAGLLAAVLCAVLPGVSHAGLVGYWSLDGDTDADAGGWGASTVQSGSNGENDISFPADVPAAIASRVSHSLAFDANNDDQVITGFRAGTAGMTSGSLTVSFWVKRTDNTPQGRPFRPFVYLGNGSSVASESFFVWRNDDPGLKVNYYTESWGTLNGSGDISTDWDHVAVTYQGGHTRLFLNGREKSGVATGVNVSLALLADAFLSLGGGIEGETSDVRFAELAIWNHSVPENQIKALANGYDPRVPIRDCDYDGIDDREQLIETRSFEISNLDPDSVFHDRIEGTPEVDGLTAAAPAPPALSDVTITADTDLQSWASASDPDEYLLVYLNGTYVGRLMQNPGEESLMIPQATWETLRAGGDTVEIALEFSAAMPTPDDGVFFAYAGLSLSYTYDRDLNDNGWLDECIPDGDPSGPDSDGDGVSDNIDRSPNTIAGRRLRTAPAGGSLRCRRGRRRGCGRLRFARCRRPGRGRRWRHGPARPRVDPPRCPWSRGGRRPGLPAGTAALQGAHLRAGRSRHQTVAQTATCRLLVVVSLDSRHSFRRSRRSMAHRPLRVWGGGLPGLSTCQRARPADVWNAPSVH
ncbi:MAG: LamG domain-containing protein [Verrucomicrobiae bacterium]|nr:LamG domain-containing protein [Verrucomicrobiae bacterium]